MYLHGWQCSEIKLYVPHRRLTIDRFANLFKQLVQSVFPGNGIPVDEAGTDGDTYIPASTHNEAMLSGAWTSIAQ